MTANVWHKTSKGMREMNYQDTQQFERATMLQLPIKPLLVLCGVIASVFILNLLNIKNMISKQNYLQAKKNCRTVRERTKR